MNNTSLIQNYGLTPLDAQEAHGTSGGWWTAAMAVGIILSAVASFGDIRDGFSDGFNGTPRYGQDQEELAL